MSVAVIGIDHKTSTLDVLERVAVQGERLAFALDILRKSDHVTECVVLSTCMRTEVYVDAVRFHPAVDDVIDVLAQMADLDRESIADQLFQLHDKSTYTHLFRVASGLESAVIGESEVLGQVARAWEFARSHGTCRSVLGGLFRHAVSVGKQARTETAIARGITSIGQAAVVMAKEAIGTLEGKSAVVVGAGEMGRNMALTLRRNGSLREITIVNRTSQRGELLATEVGGKAVALSHLAETLESADLVLTSTSAHDVVVDVDEVRNAMTMRPERPMVLVDLAVPRDVHPDVAEIAGVTVLGLDDLRAFTAQGHAERSREAVMVEEIVSSQVDAYCADVNARLVAPVIAGLYERAEEIRLVELERLRGNFTTEQQHALNVLTKSMFAKLLHDPTVRLKATAGTPEGDRMSDALRTLFGV